MRLRGMIVALTAAASLSIGLVQTLPVYAASAAPEVQTNGSLSHLVARTTTTKSVDPKTTNGCGEFKGTIEWTISQVGGNQEEFFAVYGTLHDHCGSTGVSRLYMHWTCGGGTPQGPKEGETTGSQAISKTIGPCLFILTNMYVEVCWHNNANTVHQCADSAKLN